MQAINNEIFGRARDDGNIDILFVSDETRVTQLDSDLYPVGSDLSTRYEHASGIVLTREDAELAGIIIE